MLSTLHNGSDFVYCQRSSAVDGRHVKLPLLEKAVLDIACLNSNILFKDLQSRHPEDDASGGPGTMAKSSFGWNSCVSWEGSINLFMMFLNTAQTREVPRLDVGAAN